MDAHGEHSVTVVELVAACLRPEPPTPNEIAVVFGGEWRFVDHGAWHEHVALTIGSPGVAAISYDQTPRSKRHRASLSITVARDLDQADAWFSAISRSFSGWAPFVAPIPTPGPDGRFVAPASGEECSPVPRVVLALRRSGDGRPEAIFVKWLR